MNGNNLRNILYEYSQQRQKALDDAENKKRFLYSKVPRLKEIEDEIGKSSILLAKASLNNGSTSQLNSLKNKINELKLEKKNILIKLNISDAELSPIYKCNICKDTGYISNGPITSMCNCLKQQLFNIEYNDLNTYNMQNQNFDSFNLLYYSDQVDKKNYNSDISPRENIKIIKSICNKFIDNFNNPSEKNLLFTGNSGLGKTFLSSCIANELIKKGKTVLYQTAPVMLDTIINYKMGKSQNNIYDNLLSVDLLVIDDLGTESINSLKFEELFKIINTRMLPQKNKSLKTIISTNLNLSELKSVYGERIISRFAGNYNICYFFGEDIRLKNK